MITATDEAPVEHAEALTGAATRRRAGRIVLGIAVLAVLIRVACIFLLHTHQISADHDHWTFGWETGRIARSVALGNGFADPFITPSGPGAWVVPGYPLLLALLFKIFGVYTGASAIAAFVLNSFLSGLACVLVYRLAREWFDETVGVIAAALLAVYPPSIWRTISTIWDTTLFTFCLLTLLLMLQRLPRGRTRTLTGLGLLTGLTVLINPAVLSFYAVALVYLAFKRPEIRRRPVRAVVLLALTPALVVAPWVIRNWQVLGFPTLKSNFGLELRLGNNPLAVDSPTADTLKIHPCNNRWEFAHYRLMGELPYLAQCQHEALGFIREDPGRAIRLCLRRVQIFWLGVFGPQSDWAGHLKTGFSVGWLKSLFLWIPVALAATGVVLALRRRRPLALPLLLLLTLPLPYYLTHADERYRYPIEPVLLILASYAICCVFRRGGTAHPKSAKPTGAEWVWLAKASAAEFAPRRGEKRAPVQEPAELPAQAFLE